MVDKAGGEQAFLLAQGSGRPFQFARHIPTAAQGKIAEPILPERIRQIWKTDIFLSTIEDNRNLAATIKSNHKHIEGDRGLRIGIVPESKHFGNRSGVYYDSKSGLWIASLADPDGFMGMFNDGYHAVMRALVSIGKQSAPPYWAKPSAKAQKITDQLAKYEGAKVLEIENALDAAAQQDLVGIRSQLVGVNAPTWLHMKQLAPKIISPKPSFVKL